MLFCYTLHNMMHIRLSLSTQRCISATHYTIWCISDFHCPHNNAFLLHITQYYAFPTFTFHTTMYFCYTLHNMMHFRISLSTQRWISVTHYTIWCISDFHCPHNDAFLLHITQYNTYLTFTFHTTMHFCYTLHNMMHFRLSLSTQRCISVTQYDAFSTFTVHTTMHFCYTLHNMMHI